MIKAAVTVCARIAGNPPIKQNAIATDNAASVIGGSATPLRSGQGRCNRPDVAVTFAASQRLSVSVIMATSAAAAGAMLASASIARFASSFEASSGRQISIKPRSITAVIVAALVPSVSRTDIVVSAAKPAIQSRMRPTGYHSSTGVAGAAPLPGDA